MRPPTLLNKATEPSGPRPPSLALVLARESNRHVNRKRDKILKNIIRVTLGLGPNERLMFAPLALHDNAVRVAVHTPDRTHEYDHIVLILNDHMHVLPMEPTQVRGFESALLFKKRHQAQLDICRNLQILHLCNTANEIAQTRNQKELVESLNDAAAHIELEMANGGNAWRPPCAITPGRYTIRAPWCLPRRTSGHA